MSLALPEWMPVCWPPPNPHPCEWSGFCRRTPGLHAWKRNKIFNHVFGFLTTCWNISGLRDFFFKLDPSKEIPELFQLDALLVCVFLRYIKLRRIMGFRTPNKFVNYTKKSSQIYFLIVFFFKRLTLPNEKFLFQSEIKFNDWTCCSRKKNKDSLLQLWVNSNRNNSITRSPNWICLIWRIRHKKA